MHGTERVETLDAWAREWVRAREHYCVDPRTRFVSAIVVIEAAPELSWTSVGSVVEVLGGCGFWRVFFAARPYDILFEHNGEYGLHVALPVQADPDVSRQTVVTVLQHAAGARIYVDGEEVRTDYDADAAARSCCSDTIVDLQIALDVRYGTVLAIIDLFQRRQCCRFRLSALESGHRVVARPLLD
jgi:hypothetical protein